MLYNYIPFATDAGLTRLSDPYANTHNLHPCDVNETPKVKVLILAALVLVLIQDQNHDQEDKTKTKTLTSLVIGGVRKGFRPKLLMCIRK